jgi:Zn-dependent peptidase ImmA (M78 family)
MQVEPTLLSWALDRSGRTVSDIAGRKDLKHFREWVAGSRSPSYAQLEKFAHYTHTPVGYLYLSAPPDEPVPIRDFRTIANVGAAARPSVNLLDTIYACQRRQDWYRDYAQREGIEPLDFAASARVGDDVLTVARQIAQRLGFTMAERANQATRNDARLFLVKAIEDLGVLVSVSGTVVGDTHRKLDPQEFRGFTLFDPVAPMIFINGKDTRGAQSFTLIHELAHVWAGDTGLSDAALDALGTQEAEIWANKVAAEVLVPTDSLRAEYGGRIDPDELERLAGYFKVSTLVVLKRVYDGGFLPWGDYQTAYHDELQRVLGFADKESSGNGGDFYKAQPFRVGGHHFVRAVIADTRAGNTLYREAYSLLGAATHSTFEKLAETAMV